MAHSLLWVCRCLYVYVCALREGDKVGCMLSMAEDEVQAMSGRAMRQRCIMSEMKVFATVFLCGGCCVRLEGRFAGVKSVYLSFVNFSCSEGKKLVFICIY